MLDVFVIRDGELERTSEASVVKEALAAGMPLWVDLDRPTSEEVALLDEAFGFHPLTIEDCLQERHYAKSDAYRDYLFVVLMAADQVSADQEDPVLINLAAYLGRNFLVTYHRAPLASIAGVKRRVENGGAEMLRRGMDFLFHDVVDLTVDNYFIAVRRLDDRADALEDIILEEPRREHLSAVNDLKNNVSQMRRVILDERMVLRAIVREGRHLLSEDVLPYLENVGDHLDRLSHLIELCRDTVINARDLYLSALSNRTNDTMRVLTVWGTLLLPAAVVSGIYGMNVPLPGAGSPQAFWWIVGGTAAVSGAFLGYCRYMKWI